MLDYKLLEALAMVVQEGGFERAARVLNLTQSAVSQRVRQLEEQAGQVLLARTAPPVPTPDGRRLVRHYHQVRRLEDDLADLLGPAREGDYARIPVGLNDDSLPTWFLDAVEPFLREERTLLDLRTDDQDETHRMLKEGEVAGVVSALARPVQGCRVEYLGCMHYRLLAAPDFAARFFPEGLTPEAVERAPSLVFSRRDNLNENLYRLVLDHVPAVKPIFYLPSTDLFPEFIARGHAYGMLPDQQSAPLIASGRLVDLAPGRMVTVRLHWHCWSIASRLLERLTRAVVAGARASLARE